MATLAETAARIKAARHPEDVFDGVTTVADLKKQYRQLAWQLHPDQVKVSEKSMAAEAFGRLTEWYEKAEAKLKAGHYGDRSWMTPVTLKTRKTSYKLFRHLAGGDLATAYLATEGDGSEKYVVKICRSPTNNDLLDNEREILQFLWESAPTKGLKAMAHIIKLHDSFELLSAKVRKRVNVLRATEGYYSLAEVQRAYPMGIDARDSAWMFNRVLGALLIIQQAGVVHGAILPEHVLIHPRKHNAKLIDWCYAARNSAPLSAIVPGRKSAYPPEVFKKAKTGPHTDIYMAAKTILGITNPSTVPVNIAGFYRSCLLSAAARPNDAWTVFKEFGRELEAAFGPKKYREFSMPVPSKVE